jgi:hypothetical protein
MPPADFRQNQSRLLVRRSEEARVFAEVMGHNEPKAIMLRIAKNKANRRPTAPKKSRSGGELNAAR